jgi:hypothetical protein
MMMCSARILVCHGDSVKLKPFGPVFTLAAWSTAATARATAS